jgi:uncharacterized protein
MKQNLEGQLGKIVEIITTHIPVEAIILFGSTARGEYVSDTTIQDNVTYEYQSDFDLLVVVKTEKIKNDIQLWTRIKEGIKKDSTINVPVSLVVDTINFVNSKILEGNYFYTDIKQEGRILYKIDGFVLPEPNGLTPQQLKALAQEYFGFWLDKADAFLKDYEHNIEDKSFNNAAFHLSQTTESLYFAVLLVFTGYKPKSHNLEKIEESVALHVPDVVGIFPRGSESEQELYELLTRAYIDARYKKDYVITLDQLQYLHKHVLHLKKLIVQSCQQKINQL